MFTKKCPDCEKILSYSTKANLKSSIVNNRKCISCTRKKFTGEKNPFFGKKHTEESKNKIRLNQNSEKHKTKEFKEKMKVLNIGDKNPMSGKKVFDIWVEKYGLEEAKIKQEKWKEKLSKRFSGKNNPMYGKETPKKAGNGWCGWYKQWFFRSLRELSYVINELEKNGKNWKSAENIRIKYKDYNNIDRTYSPDFIVDEKYLIEIKPVKLHNSTSVKLKQCAAVEYCKKNGLEYLLVDYKILKLDDIKKLIEDKIIILTDKTKLKMESYNAK